MVKLIINIILNDISLLNCLTTYIWPKNRTYTFDSLTALLLFLLVNYFITLNISLFLLFISYNMQYGNLLYTISVKMCNYERIKGVLYFH